MSLRRDRPPLGRPVLTRECPYSYCHELVDFIPVPESPFGDKPKYLIKAHNISYPLTGQCPVSNMYHPFDAATQAHINSAMEIHARDLLRWTMSVEGAGTVVHPNPESQSLRGVQRIGREPEPTSDDWVLGGRDDEDVAKDRITYKPKIPAHVQGQEVGRFVASITEVIGHLNLAAMKTGEALSVLSDMQDELQTVTACIEEAKTQVSMAKGDTNVIELDEYLGLLSNANETVLRMGRELEEVRNGINITHETGELYIGRLLG